MIPLQDPRLQPHGQLYQDLGEVTIDPSANSRYLLGFRLNWGTLVINAYEFIKAISYFFLLFPMIFLTNNIIPNTNNNLRDARKAVTTKAEMLRFFGITLAMSLDPTRGGVVSYWDDNIDLTETIYQHKSYGVRFKMTRHRFQELRRHLSFGPEPEDIVNILYIKKYYYTLECRSLVPSPSFY